MTDETPQPESPRHKGIYLLPNLFTTGALFAGFYAIVAAMNSRFGTACEAILIAAILDGLDGRVARLTNSQSDFGVQYDSLSDLISFGLAPALTMYLWSLSSLVEYGVAMGKIGWLAAFIFSACAALRLARFNTQVGVQDKRFFQGLASPAAAGGIITFIWCFQTEAVHGQTMNLIALPWTVVLGLLMVSNVRYFSFKSWPVKVPFLWILALVLVFVLLAIDTPKVLFGIALVYVCSGPVITLIGRRKRRRMREETGAD